MPAISIKGDHRPADRCEEALPLGRIGYLGCLDLAGDPVHCDPTQWIRLEVVIPAGMSILSVIGRDHDEVLFLRKSQNRQRSRLTAARTYGLKHHDG